MSGPEPQPLVESTPETSCENRLFSHFKGYTLSERTKETRSWIWRFGYDIQNATERRWVCRAITTVESSPSSKLGEFPATNMCLGVLTTVSISKPEILLHIGTRGGTNILGCLGWLLIFSPFRPCLQSVRGYSRHRAEWPRHIGQLSMHKSSACVKYFDHGIAPGWSNTSTPCCCRFTRRNW
jgi:hypothetical protein